MVIFSFSNIRCIVGNGDDLTFRGIAWLGNKLVKGSAAKNFINRDPALCNQLRHSFRKQTTTSLQLLQALFEWGKAQRKGVKVNPSDFLVQRAIGRCVDLLSRQAAQKNISISSDVYFDLRLHADADHFEFIIRNLLSNAIKFSYQGGAITIGTLCP